VEGGGAGEFGEGVRGGGFGGGGGEVDRGEEGGDGDVGFVVDEFGEGGVGFPLGRVRGGFGGGFFGTEVVFGGVVFRSGGHGERGVYKD